jgi:hypothetical protein
MKYLVVIAICFTAGLLAAYGMHRHVVQQAQQVDRTFKGQRMALPYLRDYVLPPDPHTFAGRLAITPGMFRPEDCNPEVVCPWGGQQRLPWWMQ